MRDKERWRELCAQIAVEQNPQQFMILVAELNTLLEEKSIRLNTKPPEGNLPEAAARVAREAIEDS